MDKQNNIALSKEARSENTLGDRLKELAAFNNELAQIVASNVSAPPELLEKLASHESKAVIKAVTSNPNTPIRTLFKLGVYFPQELLNNPVFELLALEDLPFIENISPNVLFILIQQNNVPQWILNYAANHQRKIIVDLAKLQVAKPRLG